MHNYLMIKAVIFLIIIIYKINRHYIIYIDNYSFEVGRFISLIYIYRSSAFEFLYIFQCLLASGWLYMYTVAFSTSAYSHIVYTSQVHQCRMTLNMNTIYYNY